MSAFPNPETAAQSDLSDVAALIVLAPSQRHESPLAPDETLSSVLAQARPPRLIIIVETDIDSPGIDDVRDVGADALSNFFLTAGTKPAWSKTGAPKIIRVSAHGAPRFGLAIDEALTLVPEALRCQWLWLLHDDMVARPDTLDVLISAGGDTGRVAAVGPKQVKYGQPDQLLSVGIEATASGRRVFLVEPDEIDQGQHDQREDVLAVGTAGMLTRSSAWQEVGGLDPALGPFGDGLEFGRRLWRAGYRVVVSPDGVIEHAQVSYGHDTEGRASYSTRRAAQVYNWGVGLPQIQFVGLMLWAPILAVLRSVARLFSRHPSLAFGELAAYVKLLRMTPALYRARARNQEVANVPRRALAGLESDGAEIARARRANRKIVARGTETHPAADEAALAALRKHRWRALGGFASLVGLAAILSIFAWFPYRAGIQGALWGNLPTRWSTLMAQAWSGWQVSGDGIVGPASPVLLPLSLFSAPFALIGIDPLKVGQLLVVCALPLAAATGWLLSSSFTRSTVVRIGVGASWAASATLLVPLMRGDLTALVLFLTLPLAVTGLVRGLCPPVVFNAHAVDDVVALPPRNVVAWIGLAGLSSAGAIAAAPVMVVVLPVLALMLIFASRAPWQKRQSIPTLDPPRRVTQFAAVLAVMLPGLVLILPSLVAQIFRAPGDLWVWLASPTVGSASGWIIFGLPAALPTAPWSMSLGEAARSDLVHPLLLLIGLSSAIILSLWALVATVVVTARSGIMRPVAQWAWILGTMQILLAFGQAFLPQGNGSVSTALLVMAGACFAVAVSASYEGYSLYAAQLVAEKDTRGKLFRGAPSFLAVLTSAASVTALLILGPTGLLARGGETLAMQEDDSPLLAQESGAEDPEGEETRELATVTFPPEMRYFAQPAPSPQIPVIAQEAQTGPRAARLLALSVSDDTVRAYFLRGVGTQQADLRVSPAPSPDVGEAGEQARLELQSAVATLAGYPSSAVAQTLANHAIDIVMLSSQSEGFAAIQEIIDATPGLERIGNVEGSTMWRVRPQERVPARVTVVPAANDGLEVPATAFNVDSSALRVRTHIESDVSGTLVLAEVADPGWKASLNGIALEPVGTPGASSTWRQAFDLPAGGGALHITYSQPYLMWWWIVSGGILSVIALLAAPRRMRRRTFVAASELDSVVITDSLEIAVVTPEEEIEFEVVFTNETSTPDASEGVGDD